jgi:hypothetical protein
VAVEFGNKSNKYNKREQEQQNATNTTSINLLGKSMRLIMLKAAVQYMIEEKCRRTALAT